MLSACYYYSYCQPVITLLLWYKLEFRNDLELIMNYFGILILIQILITARQSYYYSYCQLVITIHIVIPCYYYSYCHPVITLLLWYKLEFRNDLELIMNYFGILILIQILITARQSYYYSFCQPVITIHIVILLLLFILSSCYYYSYCHPVITLSNLD